MSKLRNHIIRLAADQPAGSAERTALLDLVAARKWKSRDDAKAAYAKMSANLVKALDGLDKIEKTHSRARGYKGNPKTALRAVQRYAANTTKILAALMSFGESIEQAFDTGVLGEDSHVVVGHVTSTDTSSSVSSPGTSAL
jgi:hypothetical protein